MTASKPFRNLADKILAESSTAKTLMHVQGLTAKEAFDKIPLDQRAIWTIKLPEVVVNSLSNPPGFTIVPRKEASISEFFQRWMETARQAEQDVKVTVVPEHMAAWTEEEWYAEFSRVVIELNEKQKETPLNWKALRTALEQWDLFVQIAQAAGHEITTNYEDQPAEWVGVVPSTVSYHFTGPLAERTVEDRFELILQAITEQHGGSSAVPGYAGVTPTHEDLDRLVFEYHLKGDLGRWIIYNFEESDGRV